MRACLLLAAAAVFRAAECARGEAETQRKVIDESEDGYYCYEDGHLHRNRACRFFAIVIDAGSTGTRMQLYRFVHSTAPHGLPFHVENEVFVEAKPGLSAFAARPGDAATSVRGLVQRAHELIPRELWARTPIALKATAGLRLLPGDATAQILDQVEGAVRASGFACVADCVGVLSGAEEGVHSWFTLNLLLENFNHDERGEEVDPSPARSVAAFDLGGGSTQVTYWPRSDFVFRGHEEDRHDIDFFQTHMHLYTHSYLGNGLLTARLGVLLAEEAGNERSEEHGELSSTCFPRDFHLPAWEQSLRKWSVRGNEGYSYAKCAERVRRFVAESKITPLKNIDGESLFMFSYFFDRAEQAGVVGGEETRGKGWQRVRVREFREAAEKACTRDSAHLAAGAHWLPWQCMDLTYIHSLLKDGYGLSDEREIVLAKSIRGMSVSWALGLSYALVDEYHRAVALADVEEDEEKELEGEGRINATGVQMVDSLLTVLHQTTTDVLQYFNLVS